MRRHLPKSGALLTRTNFARPSRRCEIRGHPADEQRGGGQADVCDGYFERGDSRTPKQQGSRADEARLDQAEARLDQLSELPSGPRLGHVHGHDLVQLGRVVPLRHLGLLLEHWAPVRRGGLAGVHLGGMGEALRQGHRQQAGGRRQEMGWARERF